MAQIKNAAAAMHRRKIPRDVSMAGVLHAAASGEAGTRAGFAVCDMLANALATYAAAAVAEKAAATTEERLWVHPSLVPGPKLSNGCCRVKGKLRPLYCTLPIVEVQEDAALVLLVVARACLQQ